jgi:hypothetical protein
MKRHGYGAHHQLLQQLRRSDAAGYNNFLGMDQDLFAALLSVEQFIRKKDRTVDLDGGKATGNHHQPNHVQEMCRLVDAG